MERRQVPDNEFLEIETGYQPSMDAAYHAELAYYEKFWCSCGAYILVKKDAPREEYECRCHKRYTYDARGLKPRFPLVPRG